MAGKRQRSNGTWEFKFSKKGLLKSPVYFTFDTEEEGDRYAARVEPLLDRGVIPTEMSGTGLQTLQGALDLYEVSNTLSKSDLGLLPMLGRKVGEVAIQRLDYVWVDGWIQGMKDAGLAPSTISKRVGLLARVVDWAMRRKEIALPTNPLRGLEKGYASKGIDRSKIWEGERDRRLESRTVQVGDTQFETEEGAIRSVLKNEEHLLFDMALETAMRMREMYTLTHGQVDLAKRTVFLEKTKNGSKRQVPISSVLYKILEPIVDNTQPEKLLFPYWDGVEPLEDVTNRLSHLYKARFTKAGCETLNFHDLRHEATSRIYERTNLSDLEIAKITGHKNLRMLQRYANLRASTLAERLW